MISDSLEVTRQARDSLITKDRMRVDVKAAFFVRVQQSAEAISTAAQTLGARTREPDELKELVEDKFIDALRSTAATMSIQELQDKRRDFVQSVQGAVAQDLKMNGLELESVSLTSLDQTGKQFFNPDNAFDAEGLTRLTEQTESRRKQRNDIEQDTEVQVRMKNLEATQEKLKLQQSEEFATLEQQRAIELARAEQAAAIASQQASRTQESETARIEAEREVNTRKIEAERAVQAAEIERALAVKTRQIEADKTTDTALADQTRVVELARQDTAIAIANRSRDQSRADAEASDARAEAAKAEEGVTTARHVATAERERQIQLIEAAREADRAAIGVRTSAEAERDAAENRARAVEIEAQARRTAALAQAEGTRAVNEAMNVLSKEQIELQLRHALIERLPEILERALKPMEAIDSIKIVQVGGLPGTAGTAGAGTTTGMSGVTGAPGTFPEQVMNAAMQYQIGKPIVDSVMAAAGLADPSFSGIAKSVAAMLPPPEQAAATPAD